MVIQIRNLNCNDLINKFNIKEYHKKFDFINIKHILVEDFDIFINEMNIDLLNNIITFKSHAV